MHLVGIFDSVLLISSESDLKDKYLVYTKKIGDSGMCSSKFVVGEYLLCNKLNQQYRWAQLGFAETEM